MKKYEIVEVREFIVMSEVALKAARSTALTRDSARDRLVVNTCEAVPTDRATAVHITCEQRRGAVLLKDKIV
jgi:hypothetical protein